MIIWKAIINNALILTLDVGGGVVVPDLKEVGDSRERCTEVDTSVKTLF